MAAPAATKGQPAFRVWGPTAARPQISVGVYGLLFVKVYLWLEAPSCWKICCLSPNSSCKVGRSCSSSNTMISGGMSVWCFFWRELVLLLSIFGPSCPVRPDAQWVSWLSGFELDLVFLVRSVRLWLSWSFDWFMGWCLTKLMVVWFEDKPGEDHLSALWLHLDLGFGLLGVRSHDSHISPPCFHARGRWRIHSP